MKLKILAVFALLNLSLACSKIDDFESIGDRIASPIDVAVGDDGKYFYVLNADFDRSYNEGSIISINEKGEKQSAISVPRLGRNLTVAGDDMLALFDIADADSDYEVRLYSLKNPKKPELMKVWNDIDCIPLNAVMRKDYDHFFVTCQAGKVFLGTLKSPREKSELKLVRDYQRTRRALHLDTRRELLFAFVTDFGRQSNGDVIMEDINTYNENERTSKKVDIANEVPDQFEESKLKRKESRSRRQIYQFVVYDIKAEREHKFPYRDLDDIRDRTANRELRWLYFPLKNFDGVPDQDAGVTDLDNKFYRTNFWEAKPDPFDPNAFYLSHRGRNEGDAKFANNIIHVNIIGDITHYDEDNKPLMTSEVLSFNRVYGFKGELNPDYHFPGDFEVLSIHGRLTLLVNHFKDPINFQTKQRYSIAAKLLDGGFWRDEISSSNESNSFFQIAANQRGKALSCAYYGNAVIPLDITPGTGITEGWNKIKRIK